MQQRPGVESLASGRSSRVRITEKLCGKVSEYDESVGVLMGRGCVRARANVRGKSEIERREHVRVQVQRLEFEKV